MYGGHSRTHGRSLGECILNIIMMNRFAVYNKKCGNNINIRRKITVFTKNSDFFDDK